MLKIKYKDPTTKEKVELIIAVDELDVIIPESIEDTSDVRPAISVNVSKDKIVATCQGGGDLGVINIVDDLTEAIDSGELDGHPAGKLMKAASFDYSKLSRERCVELLEGISIQCYDHEDAAELREAVQQNCLDRNLDIDLIEEE